MTKSVFQRKDGVVSRKGVREEEGWFKKGRVVRTNLEREKICR